MEFPEQGYPESRFSTPVDEDLHCAICLNVLREPLQCEMNEHHFCSPCIQRHLLNTPKCPTCMQDLTLKTLRKPARYLTKHLGFLMIQCDYESRGCPEFVKLEDLPRHIDGCGYAPVSCQNDGCCEVVNKQDQIRHETEICAQRKNNCNDCATTRKEISELKISFEEFKAKREINEESLKMDICKLKVSFEETVRKQVNEIKVAFEESARKKIDEMKASFEELMKKEIIDLKVSFEGVIQKEIGDLKFSFGDQENEACKTMPMESPINIKHLSNSPQEFCIVVIGGCNNTFSFATDRLCSTEMYVWSKQKWVPLPETDKPRSGASAVVFNNKIVVAGGRINQRTLTNSIECLCLDSSKVSQWGYLTANLPYPSSGHNCNVYEDTLIITGGKEDVDNTSDGIYEIIPFGKGTGTCNLLSTIPTGRDCHRAELIGNEIVIIGGTTNEQGHETYQNDILVYNIITKEFKLILRLCDGIKNMASVTWGDNVIIIGGESETGEILNDIWMLNIKTRKERTLPSMSYKRSNSTGVVINNHIVVMGGFNKGTFLKEVECFSFTTNTWTELPPMNEARSSATSVVAQIPVNLI